MTTSDDTNDILDMLFDVDDPVLSGGFSPLLKQEELDLLKDFEFMMQQPSHVESAENEFWKTFMKTDDNFSSLNPQTVAVPNFGDSFSDQSSPPSHSDSYSPGAPSVCSEQSECNSDGSDSQNKYDGTTMMNFIHDYSSMSKMPNAEDGIELGADVVVMTSQDNTKWEINTDDYKTNVKREQEHTTSEDDDMCTVDFTVGAEGPPVLKLTAEEKRLFRKEGLQIPTHLPLTKAEERELKRIRRKIRNKQSAQDSRKRKKEYVEGLESRVKLCSAQNIQLQKRVEMLEKQNMSLLNQLKRLQSLVSSSATKPVQTSTCVMVLLLSFVLLLIPSWAPSSMNKGLSFSANHNNNPDKSPPIPGHSRTLLHKTDIMANDIAKTEIMSNDLTGMAENENLSLPMEKKSDYVDLTSEVYEEEIETMQEDVLPSSYTTEIIDKIEPGKPDLALPSNFSGSKVFVRPVEERVVVKWVHEA